MTQGEQPDLAASEQVEMLDNAVNSALIQLANAADAIENAMATLAQALGE
jgi:hypothetical protein